MSEEQSADLVEVKKRVEHCGDLDYRTCLQTVYECCARVSEVVGASSPGDTSEARGPTRSDAEGATYITNEGKKERAFVVNVKTAKRGGMVRSVGLPIDRDAWASRLPDYFWNQGDGPVFPFTRQAIHEYIQSNAIFEGLFWPVQEYSIFLAPAVRDASGQIIQQATIKKVDGHMKPFTIHSLRDMRATELIVRYDFNGADLAIHGGWKVQRAVAGVTPVIARYLNFYREWRKPFPKLLIDPLLKPLDAPPSNQLVTMQG